MADASLRDSLADWISAVRIILYTYMCAHWIACFRVWGCGPMRACVAHTGPQGLFLTRQETDLLAEPVD